MADAEDKDKAEKVAAARKRYEELKKQKAKKGGGAAKKGKKAKDDKGDDNGSSIKPEDAGVDEGDEQDGDGDEPAEEAAAEGEGASRARSASLRKADGDVQDVYKKQAARIEQLERDNKRLEKAADDGGKKLSGAESELDVLREELVELAAVKGRAARAAELEGEVDKLKAEVTALERQNATLQTSSAKRRASTAASGKDDELSAQLAAKTSAAEALELELSKLRHAQSAGEARASDLETQLEAAKASSSAAEKQLAELRTALEGKTPKEQRGGDAESRAREAESRIALLASDVSAAQRSAADATGRAAGLEKKLEALSTLHREAEARSKSATEARLEELERLRAENTRLRVGRPRKSVDGDGGGVEELEDEERRALQTRVRELEGEVFELKRGVWREKRRDMQTDDDAVGSPGSFDDVDLSPAPGGSVGRGGRRQSSGYGAFANVLNAFTGATSGGAGAGHGHGHGHARQQSAAGGFLDDDGDDMEFDEEAFAKAQEEEAKARLERVREVKRGLNGWKGWRVDLVDLRGGPMAGVFDV